MGYIYIHNYIYYTYIYIYTIHTYIHIYVHIIVYLHNKWECNDGNISFMDTQGNTTINFWGIWEYIILQNWRLGYS